jgi:hypothetical protein
MNIVLENDGQRAIVRRSYIPLSELKTSFIFADDIGLLCAVYRSDFNLTKEQFLAELPVGGECK